ncbi:hypothetical protein VF21_08507 [Pseudogymnoascus sp. 05NY08]|nr:hypothetical protein VF21_08507 [Pseudogymnoascus sp. 05NY08]
MVYISGGYAQRVLSTRPSNEYQEGPEEESWVREYDLSFGAKRPGSQTFDNQVYPVKRPRHTPEASYPYGRQEDIHPRINGNTAGHPSRHLPAPANLLHEQAQYGSNIPQSNRVQSIQIRWSTVLVTPRYPPWQTKHKEVMPVPINLLHKETKYPRKCHPRTPNRIPDNPTAENPWPSLSVQARISQASFSSHRTHEALALPVLHHHRNTRATGTTSNLPTHKTKVCHLHQYLTSGLCSMLPGLGRQATAPNPPLKDTNLLLKDFKIPHQDFKIRLKDSNLLFKDSDLLLKDPNPLPKDFNLLKDFKTRVKDFNTDVQPRSETNFANQANIPKLPAVKRTGPFIFDDDEDEIGHPTSLITNTETKINTATTPQISGSFILDDDEDETRHSTSLINNTETRINTATAPQISLPSINFAQGRRGTRPLTDGLDDFLGQKKDAGSRDQKSKSVVKRSKRAEEAALKKQSEAYAKIKEKQDMAAKAKNTDALFEEPINEAAQARIQVEIQKEETRKREAEARRRYKEELETIKKDDAEHEKARKEAERAERASKKVKTQEEREALQKLREKDDKKRHEEQKRKAEELLLRKRQEQSEREAAVIEKEAAAERKRQQDAENLKKTLEASKLAATSLKPAKKGQDGREENAERAITTAIEAPTPEHPAEDGGGLFVPEHFDMEISDDAVPTGGNAAVHTQGDLQRPPLTPTSPPKSDSIPNIEQKASNIAATIKEIPGSEALSLRALGGWKGARKANTETKVASIVIEHYIEILSAQQKKRDEAFAQERAREVIKLERDFAALFEKLASTLTGKVQGDLKAAVDKVLNARPPIMPTNARNGLSTARGITVSPMKYASETQCFLGGKPTKQPKELAPLGEKSPSDSEARRREKDEIRLAEKAKKRFEVKLHRDNAEQGRYMSEYEFRSTIEGQVKDYREKRKKKYEKEKKMMAHGGGSPQGRARFGYEDIDFNEGNSTRPSKSNSQSDKGRCGGVMARLRESNGYLGHFQEAAAAKIVDDRMHHLGDDADSESEVSEEDPDDDESDTAIRARPKPAASADRRDSPSDTKATGADRMATFEYDNKPTQVIKPRYLQDKEMVYVFSVQRSEIRDEEKSLSITLKQFFDKDDANEFAEEELRRTRWGPSTFRPQITQWYSETGLFNGRASIYSEDNVVECVDVVAQAQYIGDFDDFEHEKVKAIYKPKLYLIFKSITKKVQTPMGSCDDEAIESEEAEQSMDADESEEAEQNMEIDQNGEAEQVTETDHNGEVEQFTETDPNGEAEQAMEACQNEGAEQGTDTGRNDNEKSDDHFRELGGDDIDALFEEEAEINLSESSGQNLADNVHQLSLDSTSPGTKPEMRITLTYKALKLYTDRELANKQASEIFLAKIRPVGGDIAQLVAFQNDAEKPVRESVESDNKSGDLFSASNEYANSGEEIRIWVEDFETDGPLN